MMLCRSLQCLRASARRSVFTHAVAALPVPLQYNGPGLCAQRTYIAERTPVSRLHVNVAPRRDSPTLAAPSSSAATDIGQPAPSDEALATLQRAINTAIEAGSTSPVLGGGWAQGSVVASYCWFWKAFSQHRPEQPVEGWLGDNGLAGYVETASDGEGSEFLRMRTAERQSDAKPGSGASVVEQVASARANEASLAPRDVEQTKATSPGGVNEVSPAEFAVALISYLNNVPPHLKDEDGWVNGKGLERFTTRIPGRGRISRCIAHPEVFPLFEEKRSTTSYYARVKPIGAAGSNAQPPPPRFARVSPSEFVEALTTHVNKLPPGFKDPQGWVPPSSFGNFALRVRGTRKLSDSIRHPEVSPFIEGELVLTQYRVRLKPAPGADATVASIAAAPTSTAPGPSAPSNVRAAIARDATASALEAIAPLDSSDQSEAIAAAGFEELSPPEFVAKFTSYVSDLPPHLKDAEGWVFSRSLLPFRFRLPGLRRVVHCCKHPGVSPFVETKRVLSQYYVRLRPSDGNAHKAESPAVTDNVSPSEFVELLKAFVNTLPSRLKDADGWVHLGSFICFKTRLYGLPTLHQSIHHPEVIPFFETKRVGVSQCCCRIKPDASTDDAGTAAHAPLEPVKAVAARPPPVARFLEVSPSEFVEALTACLGNLLPAFKDAEGWVHVGNISHFRQRLAGIEKLPACLEDEQVRPFFEVKREGSSCYLRLRPPSASSDTVGPAMESSATRGDPEVKTAPSDGVELEAVTAHVGDGAATSGPVETAMQRVPLENLSPAEFIQALTTRLNAVPPEDKTVDGWVRHDKLRDFTPRLHGAPGFFYCCLHPEVAPFVEIKRIKGVRHIRLCATPPQGPVTPSEAPISISPSQVSVSPSEFLTRLVLCLKCPPQNAIEASKDGVVLVNTAAIPHFTTRVRGTTTLLESLEHPDVQPHITTVRMKESVYIQLQRLRYVTPAEFVRRLATFLKDLSPPRKDEQGWAVSGQVSDVFNLRTEGRRHFHDCLRSPFVASFFQREDIGNNVFIRLRPGSDAMLTALGSVAGRLRGQATRRASRRGR